MGNNAQVQPGNLQELMLHETAVSWIRHKLATSVPVRPWEETRAEFAVRIKAGVRAINETHDVAGLTYEFPERLSLLLESEGGRISK